MNAAPLVSVLVRSMDRSTLARTLESIATQSHANVEVVVIAACGARHRELPTTCGAFPLRLIRSEMPLRRAAAANAALDAARGEWLNLLDDDDVFLPEHIGTLHAALAQHPQAQLAYARSLAIDASGACTETGTKFKRWRHLDTPFFHSQAALFSRQLIEAGVRFDTRFDILEDMDFFVQCAQRTPFVFVERVTSISYRDDGESGTGGGTRRDAARIDAAALQLRTKWAALEQRLHAMAEFRLEKALWLLERGDRHAAEVETRAVLLERPDWADAHALAALLAASSGDAAGARQALLRAGDAEPEETALRQHVTKLRAWLQTR
jgi:glycosyltransferase involved in cell wall biosynthesis